MKIIIATLVLAAQSSFAIVIRSPMATPSTTDGATLTQDRFNLAIPGATLNPEFSYTADTFSGVGWDSTSTNSRKSVTLISDRHFLAARHFTPSTALNAIEFRRSDGSIHSSTATYSNVSNPTGSGLSGNSDLIIGTLATPVNLITSGISPFKILDPSLSTVGQNIIMYGQRGRIGESYVVQTSNTTVSGTNGNADFSLYYEPTGADNDAFLTIGDSGGPSFVTGSDGSLILTGIHWAVGSLIDLDFTANLDTNVPFYLSEIEDITGPGFVETSLLIAPSTLQPFPNPIPEPSSSALLILSFGSLCFRRTR